MMQKSQPILVTGSKGLAGSAVVNHLRSEGYTSIMPLTRRDVDLRNHEEVARLFKMLRPRYVFHAAATVYGLGGNMKFQAQSILDNTLINTAVIDAAHTCGSVRKITVMGTNAAYPWPTELPFHEANIYNGRPDKGEFGYGHAKRHMLAMLEAYQMSYGMEYTYIVSGNLYGPRDRFNVEMGHVLPSLVKKFSRAKDDPGTVVSIWGDGSATRDFLYIEDLARIVHMLMSDEDAMPQAINIGSGQRTSISELAVLLSEVSGVDLSRVKFDLSKPTGRPDCYADLSKLRALGFVPRYTMARGLAETWEWFRNTKGV